MSKEDIERLGADAKSNADLAEAIKGAGTDMGALVAVAKEKGYDFTAEELNEYAEAKKGELSEEDMEKVAGGGDVSALVVAVHVAVVG